MDSDDGVIDLTDEVPSNKRQRIEAGSSSSVELTTTSTSALQRTGPHWAYPQTASRKTKGGKKSLSQRRPSPEENDSLFELGTVRLPCEAVQQDQQGKTKTSIHSLAARICPYGFVRKSDNSPEDFGDSLCMDNLFDRNFKSWSMHGCVHESKHINLDPVPLPKGVELPSQPRLQAVTVFHCDGSRAPMTYGISVDWSATNGQLAERVQEQCNIRQDQHIELILLRRGVYLETLNKSSLLNIPSDGRARGSHHYSDSWTDMHCTWLGNSEGSDSDDPESDSGSDGPSEKLDSRVVAYVLPKGRDGGTGDIIVYFNCNALPVLVRIPSKHLLGGNEADKHVRAAIKKALAPAALAGQASSDSKLCFELLHSTQLGHNIHLPFTAKRSGMWFDGCSFVRAEFAPRSLDGEFDMKIMAEPQMHESADEIALAETVKGTESMQTYMKAQAEAAAEPWTLVDELKLAARATRYPSMQEWATIQVGLSIEPASQRKNETRGHVVLKVWWRRNGHMPVPAMHRLMQDLDDWVSFAQQRDEYFIHVKHRLKTFMHALCKGQPHFDHMQAELKKWAEKDEQKQRTLPGMMTLLQAGERPEAAQPEGLSVELRPYQRQSVKFMLDIENSPGGFRSMLFTEVKNSKGETYWYSPSLGRICEHVPAMPQGGILGEEMGLGKTVEVAALVLSNPTPPMPTGQQKTETGHIRSRATLVVCPVSLMGQWADELADKAKGNLKVLLHHGPKRTKDPTDLLDYDIVLVTYQTLALEYSRANKEGSFKPVSGSEVCFFPPCGAIQWHRIVLDEAHTVKNPNAQLTNACTALAGQKRWCVTGTPVGSDISDLKGQFRFLHAEPFTNKNFFARYVKPSYSGSHWARPPADTLLYMLGQCMIRHTKLQVLGGEEVLQLPPKTEELVPVYFTEAEQQLYMHVDERAKAKYQMFRSHGPHMVSKKLIQIMSALLPLRRICSGGKLSDRDLTIDLPDSVGHVATAVDPNAVCTEEACCICLESPVREPTRTPCNHWFCWECVGALLQGGIGSHSSLTCPLCRARVQGQLLVKGVNEGAAALEEEDSMTAVLEEKASTSESKLMALLEELRLMRERDPTAKALVFSQFVSTLDWLKQRLEQQGFGYRTISGSMTLKRRAQAIEAFQKDPPTTVFLLSMRSGSVGINLTSANYVFLLEPALNPALEEQAIGRAWRMGQQRPVHVKKLYVKGTVEERIMEMVKHRMEGTGGSQPSTTNFPNWSGWPYPFVTPAGPAREQVKAQDIAGSMKADKQNLRMEELDLLFQPPGFGATS